MEDSEEVWAPVKKFPEYETNGRGVVRNIKRKYVLKAQTEDAFDLKKRFTFYKMRRGKYYHRVPVSKILAQGNAEIVSGRIKTLERS